MPLKSIAVFFETNAVREARVAYAARLAHRHGAHLIGIFMAPSLFNGSIAESFVQGQTAVREVIVLHRQRKTKRLSCQTIPVRDLPPRGLGFEFRALSRTISATTSR